ncbi:MAG: MFS transporter [Anaerolineae bacterium]|jgi:predicted MFS family arabinose efflux permease|nr:MFS transporter [Anaerolineae bacterium]MBT3713193.1 MFS transporter [Anaerolineae bacterium]MBT4310380.1 MFS transporter [Anaerolineae bacterium]MBT4458896.1 MFS transporter [Anaerolineae bacterium]MBT4842374.1 MFS transporter [Anaerolineae bacterium]
MQTNKSRNFLFYMFGALYFVQGVIQAYQLNFFKPHLNAEGIPADKIATLAGLALVPFMLKWVFGILSDRVNFFGKGYRVPYMALGVILSAVAFGSAFWISPADQFGAMTAVVLIAVSAMTLFDATADALAVDITEPEDHARVQSVMTGGRAAGFIILSLVFGIIAERMGFSAIFLVMGVIILFPLIMVFQVKEPDQRAQREKFNWGAFKQLIRPNYLLYIFFIILAWTTFQGIDGLVTLYMSDELQISPAILGRYGMFKGLGMVIGALILGWLINKIGIRNAALSTVSMVTVGGFIFSKATGINTILVVGVIWGIVVAFHWTVYSTFSMGITDKRIAGSMFAILMTVGNIGIGAGEALATRFVDNLGYSGVFSAIALINLGLIPILFFALRGLQKERAQFTG